MKKLFKEKGIRGKLIAFSIMLLIQLIIFLSNLKPIFYSISFLVPLIYWNIRGDRDNNK